MSVVKTTSPSVFTIDFTILVRGKRKGETAGEYISKYTAGLGSTTSRVLHISPQCLFLLKYNTPCLFLYVQMTSLKSYKSLNF